MRTSAKSTTPKKSNKETKLPECECGCGATTKGGRFLPGHDAKLKKELIGAALGGSKRAEAKLEKLGWTSFLDIQRARVVIERAARKAMQSSRRAATTLQETAVEPPREQPPHRSRRPRKAAKPAPASAQAQAPNPV
ncbi:MAG: hypothetical protein QOD99_2395 [Chthoniobacter sp.]|jgi:hypothetical protein|nr:hypothetical protein [Chthoniobacter sp.]